MRTQGLVTGLVLLAVCDAWSGQVTLKIAVDLQGAVDDLDGKPRRFTSSASLDAVHRLRRASDAVLVGVGTVVRDDPSLTVRRVSLRGRPQPMRVVVDPSARAPDSAAIFDEGVAATVRCVLSSAREVSQSGVVRLAASPDGSLPPLALLDALQELGVQHLMIEGGPSTARRFLEAKLVDRAIIVRAPVAFARPVLSGLDGQALRAAGLSLDSRRTCEGDETQMWTTSETDPLWDVLGIPEFPWSVVDLE